ncbi:MAG: type II secretion system F family protein [Planctomycetes bacterium]|nr:type II secretion system F family protein [Planctomycetota bacterium]
MATFQYAAKDASGKTVTGSIQANDRNEAVNQLRGRELIILKVEEGGKAAKGEKKSGAGAGGGGGSAPSGGRGGGFFSLQPKASKAELVIFTRQLSTMISAGISLLEAIEVLTEQAETPGMKACCQRLTSALRGGNDLSAAMAMCPKAFSPLYVSMVTAGEASGQMDVILQRLADYVEASEELKREIKSAMTYPVISLVLVLSITAFLMIGVVPGFKEVFDGLGAELPALTKFTLSVSDWLRTKWYLCFIGMFGLIAGVVVFKRTPQGALLIDHLALRVPIFGPLARKVCLARFSRTFATLVRSGVPIMGTLDIVAATAGNRVISNAVYASRDAVRNGNMLSEPLSKSKVFPPMVVRMIAIGEKSGALEQLLEKIAEFYDSQVKASIKALTSLIEPLLICFMGGIVGVVILSVFLPILNLIGELSSK